MTVGRVLIIAGSDPSGGAGIQADIKAVTMNGAYAATAITALTIQNSLGVQEVMPVPPEIIRKQMKAVLDDIGANVVKIGMLHSAEVIRLVADVLAEDVPDVPIVLDPVMVATSGDRLLEEDAEACLIEALLPRATLVTPNIPEAERLSGLQVHDEQEMDKAAQALLKCGPRAVLVKGGHLPGKMVVDLLVTEQGAWRYAGLRVESRHTHGTGCTLASAIAAQLAQGIGLADSVEHAHDYVLGAIRQAPGFGQGSGPIHHGWLLGETGLN